MVQPKMYMGALLAGHLSRRMFQSNRHWSLAPVAGPLLNMRPNAIWNDRLGALRDATKEKGDIEFDGLHVISKLQIFYLLVRCLEDLMRTI